VHRNPRESVSSFLAACSQGGSQLPDCWVPCVPRPWVDVGQSCGEHGWIVSPHFREYHPLTAAPAALHTGGVHVCEGLAVANERWGSASHDEQLASMLHVSVVTALCAAVGDGGLPPTHRPPPVAEGAEFAVRQCLAKLLASVFFTAGARTSCIIHVKPQSGDHLQKRATAAHRLWRIIESCL
jgi:hypothetical protein